MPIRDLSRAIAGNIRRLIAEAAGRPCIIWKTWDQVSRMKNRARKRLTDENRRIKISTLRNPPEDEGDFY